MRKEPNTTRAFNAIKKINQRVSLYGNKQSRRYEEPENVVYGQTSEYFENRWGIERWPNQKKTKL